jgi:hypothetical protein
MGARSSRNTTQNNRSDGHLLEYFRKSFVRGGGGTNFVPPPLLINYLVVAGGGSGGAGTNGHYASGGGGAGGLRSTVTATGGGGTLETALTFTLNTNYTVTVGAGGPSITRTDSFESGAQGSNSVLDTITSTGGGGGGTGASNATIGGSGGGGSGGCGQGVDEVRREAWDREAQQEDAEDGDRVEEGSDMEDVVRGERVRGTGRGVQAGQGGGVALQRVRVQDAVVGDVVD